MTIYRVSPETAAQMVGAIIKDLTGRRGLRQEWEEIDPETQDEIRETWAKLLMFPPSESP